MKNYCLFKQQKLHKIILFLYSKSSLIQVKKTDVNLVFFKKTSEPFQKNNSV
jgi:hypothetical protein